MALMRVTFLIAWLIANLTARFADEGGGGGGSGEGAGGSGGSGANGGDAEGGASGSGSAESEGTAGKGDKGGDGKVEFTPEQQAHIDALIAKQHGKAKSAAEAEFKKWLDQQSMDEADRLKAEKADAEKRAADAVAGAHARLVRSEAKVAAVADGVDAKKADRFVKLLDLGDVEVDDGGEVDASALKKAIAATLKEFPEFKAVAGGGRGASGGDMNGGGGKDRAKTLDDAVAAHYAG